ncbi:MAG: murein biosynthesis integral membrane protein MurJ [Alphaproteobacteria bacterium]|nr:murein biosynthesis integral membrane protein MurJ [Alphaproteobacteria bacterium]
MTLSRAIATVGGWTMASRLLGFVRDTLIADRLGAGPLSDAFFVAFRLPNLFRSLFAEGAFNAAFVPQFSAVLTRDGRAAALAYAGRVLAVMLAALVPFTILAELAMPALVLVLAPGFAGDAATFALAVEFARVTFPYLMFIALAALIAGVLNSLDRFAAAAAVPVLLNLTLIAALLGFGRVLATPAHALAWGVAVAGMAQFVWLAVALERNGTPLRLPWPRLEPRVRRTLALMVPGAIGAGVMQINIVVGTMLASLLGSGAISWLYYADRVAQLPLGVIGVAVGVALLPLVSRRIAAGDAQGAADAQCRAIEGALLLTLPAAVALATIPGPIITTLFERGAFTAADSAAAQAALAAYAAGLPAFVLVKALAPGFFARHDTATPVKVAAAAVVLNIVAALALMQVLGHVGIALATTLAGWLNAGCLAVLLLRRGHLRLDTRLRVRAPRILAASLVMGLSLWGLSWLLQPAWSAGGLAQAGALTLVVAAGLAVYAAAAAATGAARPADLRQMLRRSRA